MSELLFELRAVSKRFRRGDTSIDAVDAVDLDLGPGELVAIEGPSGSGKTTLLQLLGALDRPDEGVVAFEGRELQRLADRELAELRLRAFGFVFQQFNLIPTLSAIENVQAVLAPAGLRRDRLHGRARALLDEVGLGERVSHLPSHLWVESSSAWRSPGRWPASRASSWPTSRPGTSTRRRAQT